MYDICVGTSEGRSIGKCETKPQRGELVVTDEGERYVLYVIGSIVVVEGREPDPREIPRRRRARDVW